MSDDTGTKASVPGGEKLAKKKKCKKGPVDKPERSLCCLGLNNPLRRLCYAITEWKGFEYIILVTILATCVCLGLATPYPNDDSDSLNDSLEELEIVFTVIFTAECVMKIIAMGLIAHEGAYLRGGLWNLLDFTIVSMGLLEPLLSAFNVEGLDVKALRAFRVLRPLRLVSGVPALQIVMNAILMAMIPLAQIALLVLFVLAIYAIIGLEMFEGQLHKTCFNNKTGEMMADPVNCGGAYNCEDLEPDWVCRPYWDGPSDGILNFDNILLAMITVYQCLSREGWTDVMYSLQDSMNTGWEWVYFISMVIFGSFFVMNLVLGVLAGEFSKQKEKQESREKFQKMREQRHIETSMTNYLEWITTGEAVINKDAIKDGEPIDTSDTEENILAPPSSSFCKSCWGSICRINQRIRDAGQQMIKSQVFYWTIVLLVFLNTAVLATEHYHQPDWLGEFQRKTNLFFVALFVLEMFLKMYTLGLAKYFRSLFNRFDFFATLSSILELVLVRTEMMNPVGVSVLRCIRLLRIFKVTRYWKAMTSLVSSLVNSIQSIAALLLLLFLFIMIFALLGMQIFGGKFGYLDPSDYTPRTNFDSFSYSLLSVFQIMVGEWNIMYLGINSAGGISNFPIVAILYIMVLFTFGSYILLNVFLAIAVDNLGDPEDDEGNQAEAIDEKKGEEENADEEAGANEPPPPDPPCPPIPEGPSFFLLSQQNPLRVFFHRVLCHPFVGNFLLISILVSSALMAAEDPVYDDSPRNKVLGKIDYFFTTVFTLELLFKLVVYGLIFHPGAFLRDPANILDFVVVGVSLVSIFSTSGAVSTIKILRVARVLRPLRAINRAKGLKRVIQCMIVAIKTIWNILVVTSLLEFMYAVIGVQLFKGGMFHCTDTSRKSPEECQGYYIAYEDGDTEKPVVEEREWVNNPFNFDSVPNGMLTLFTVATFEGWPALMFLCIDAAGEDQAPIHDNRMVVALFYMSFLVIVSFFMINIFVGFVILTFTSEGEKEYEHCDLDKNQRECLEFALHAKPMKRYIPSSPFQYKCWSLVISQPFDYVSFTLIILNTISMAMKFYQQPEWYTELLEYCNIFFTVAFTVEFLLKLVAFGPKVYFSDAWNLFDALIVAGSYIDILFSEVNIAFFKLFRVGRLIKLLNKSEGIRTILFKFIKSLGALPYVILLIVLLFFIYAIIGMQTFGKIAIDEDTQINRNNNFQTFGNTLILLFRCATGEGYQEIMLACSGGDHVMCFHPPPEGWEESTNSTTTPTCGSNVAFPYFISFVVCCNFLILNLFVAVIMDNFDYLTRDWSILGVHHLPEFIQLWSEYDPHAVGKMEHEDLIALLRKINPPLGFGRLCPKNVAAKRLVAMKVTLNSDGTVSFNATLFALVRAGLQIKTEGNSSRHAADAELRETILMLWQDTDTQLLDEVIPPPTSEQETVATFYAAMLIQEYVRKFRKRKMAALLRDAQQQEVANQTKNEHKLQVCRMRVHSEKRSKAKRKTWTELVALLENEVVESFDRTRQSYYIACHEEKVPCVMFWEPKSCTGGVHTGAMVGIGDEVLL